MVAFQGKAEAAGAIVVLRNRFCPAGSALDGFDLAVGGDEPATIHCRCLVNGARPHAPFAI